VLSTFRVLRAAMVDEKKHINGETRQIDEQEHYLARPDKAGGYLHQRPPPFPPWLGLDAI
jgi:hypothetical protein